MYFITFMLIKEMTLVFYNHSDKNILPWNCSPLPIYLSCLGHPIFKKNDEFRHQCLELFFQVLFPANQPDNSDLHSRQRSANTALHPLPLKRVRQGHPYLCHTIPGHKQAILIPIPHKIGQNMTNLSNKVWPETSLHLFKSGVGRAAEPLHSTVASPEQIHLKALPQSLSTI